MINYGQHYLDKKDFKAVSKVLGSKNLTQGKLVGLFEKSLTNYFGAKYACSISNATSGLYLLSEIYGWKKNDNIFLSPLTFLAGANSVARSDARPNFVDINKNNYNLDLDLLEHLIKKKKKFSKSNYSNRFCWTSLRLEVVEVYCRQISMPFNK